MEELLDRNVMDSVGEDGFLSNISTVTLVVEGEKFECSRSLLASSSDYFKKIFKDEYVEAKRDSIELKNFYGGPEIMKLLIQFLETKMLQGVDIYAHLLLLMSASMFQFTEIQSFCTKSIRRNLTVDNCLDAYRIANLISAEVAEASLTLALWKFREVVTNETSSFWEQPIELIEDYLGIRRGLVLGEEGEWSVVEAALQWIQKTSDERRQHLERLLNVFDYKQLTVNDVGSLLFYDVIEESDTAKNLLLEVKKQKTNQANFSKELDVKKRVNDGSADRLCAVANKTNELSNVMMDCFEKCEENSSRTGPSCVTIDVERRAYSLLHRATRDVLFSPCVIGFKLDSCFQEEGGDKDVLSSFIKILVPVLYVFDVVKRCVRSLTVLEKQRQDSNVCIGFQACAVGPSIYVMGGEYQLGRNQWNNDVWSYNSILQTWKVHESLRSNRRHHLLCSLNDTIYLIGGTGRYRRQLNSIEAYDSRTDQWKVCESPPLDFFVGAAVCAFKDQLLVFTSSQLLTYHPNEDSWTSLKLKKSFSLGYQSAVAYHDYVYLLGRSSTLVFKFLPGGDDTVGEAFGYFNYITVNMCAVKNNLYSFTHVNGIRKEDRIVEMLNLNEKPSSSDGNSFSERKSIAAEIVWRDGDRANVFMADDFSTSYSCGCFSLFRI